MENKLIKTNSKQEVSKGIYKINADFTLGNIDLLISKNELERLEKGGNMDRITKEQYK